MANYSLKTDMYNYVGFNGDITDESGTNKPARNGLFGDIDTLNANYEA